MEIQAGGGRRLPSANPVNGTLENENCQRRVGTKVWVVVDASHSCRCGTCRRNVGQETRSAISLGRGHVHAQSKALYLRLSRSRVSRSSLRLFLSPSPLVQLFRFEYSSPSQTLHIIAPSHKWPNVLFHI